MGPGNREGAVGRTGPRRGGQTAPQRAADLALFTAAAFLFFFFPFFFLWGFGELFLSFSSCFQARWLNGWSLDIRGTRPCRPPLPKWSDPVWETKRPRRSEEGVGSSPLPYKGEGRPKGHEGEAEGFPWEHLTGRGGAGRGLSVSLNPSS